MKSLAFHIVLSFTLSYLLSIVSVDAVDSLEYIALKRIEKHKKPRIIQVPIYTVRQHQPHIPQESARFPLFVPIPQATEAPRPVHHVVPMRHLQKHVNQFKETRVNNHQHINHQQHQHIHDLEQDSESYLPQDQHGYESQLRSVFKQIPALSEIGRSTQAQSRPLVTTTPEPRPKIHVIEIPAGMDINQFIEAAARQSVATKNSNTHKN